ncbi:hypothetical protein [Mycoplasmopsis primatum]|uniref:hypothetical protein n=1 Tax=Mycoplasmopsis primatum TaxID=55604 RepID=UPI000A5BB85A|nr:hypothetical protein [Mycoplasmopsis primatum]
MKKSRKLLLSFGVGASAISVPLLFVSASTDPVFEPFDEDIVKTKYSNYKESYTFEKNVNAERIFHDFNLNLDTNYYGHFLLYWQDIFSSNSKTLRLGVSLQVLEKIVADGYFLFNNGQKLFLSQEQKNKWNDYVKNIKNRKIKDPKFYIQFNWDYSKTVEKSKWFEWKDDPHSPNYDFSKFNWSTFYKYWYEKGYVLNDFHFRDFQIDVGSFKSKWTWSQSQVDEYFWNFDKPTDKKFFDIHSKSKMHLEKNLDAFLLPFYIKFKYPKQKGE